MTMTSVLPARDNPPDLAYTRPVAVSWNATATDNIDGTVPVVCNPPSGGNFPLGVHTVSCAARDRSGNESTGSFQVTVVSHDPKRTPEDPDGDGIPGTPGFGSDRCPFHPENFNGFEDDDGCPDTPPPTAPDPGGTPVTLVPLSGIPLPPNSTRGTDGRIHVTGGRVGTSFPIDVGDARCKDGSVPSAVEIELLHPNGGVISVNPLSRGANGRWTGIVHAPPNGYTITYGMRLVAYCPDRQIQDLGTVTLHDPSGYITDSVTKQPIVGARVVLQRLVDGNWIDADPATRINGSPIMSPEVNPLLTDETGHYAWDVAAGSWRVIVSATGYITQTSRVVVIPPPVTDLHLALVPTGGGQTTTTTTTTTMTTTTTTTMPPFQGAFRATAPIISSDP
jgi:hypothetical protein